MRAGGRRYVVVPPSMGYGSDGIPGHVPSDSVLILEVKLFAFGLAKLIRMRYDFPVHNQAFGGFEY
jgi:hypothetical protein